MMLAAPIVTALTAGVLILMQMALLFSVVRLRRSAGQSLGDGGDQDLQLAIRRHGNFAENAGIFIACFALLEMLGGGGPVFMVLCAGFVLGRLSHIIGLSMRRTVTRSASPASSSPSRSAPRSGCG
jgi:hypothetical protein